MNEAMNDPFGAKVKEAKALIVRLASSSKADLKADYERSHRVCDTRGMTKDDFITAIIFDNYSSRVAAAAFGC